MEKRKLQPRELAWLGIAAYELGALAVGGGHTLSEGLDEYCDNENRLVKYGTRAWIGYTALHLANVLPKRIDIYHQLTKLKQSQERSEGF